LLHSCMKINPTVLRAVCAVKSVRRVGVCVCVYVCVQCSDL
jgi:hypothetical protein